MTKNYLKLTSEQELSDRISKAHELSYYVHGEINGVMVPGKVEALKLVIKNIADTLKIVDDMLTDGYLVVPKVPQKMDSVDIKGIKGIVCPNAEGFEVRKEQSGNDEL